MLYYNWSRNKFIEENFSDNELLEANNLTERERYIAQELVGRGVLDKTVEGKNVQYKLNVNNMVR